MKNNINPGQLFLTTTQWEAYHMRKNPHGVWVPKQKDDNKILLTPGAMFCKSIIPPETPAMYIGTDGRPTVGVFLVADNFLELPYNILKEIKVG